MIPQLRCDDFPCGMPEYRYHPELLEQVENLGVPYWLGIVPDLLTEDDTAKLLKLNHAIFAQHGFDHGFSRWRPQSEFDGMTETDLTIKLVETRRNLTTRGLWNATHFRAFIPPFNRFSQELLNSLNHEGFTHITGGPESYSQQATDTFDFGALTFVPSLPPYYTSNGSFTDTVRLLSEVPIGSQVTIHLCDTYGT